jgi:maltooligosyltrehalose trehalohydrolase
MTDFAVWAPTRERVRLLLGAADGAGSTADGAGSTADGAGSTVDMWRDEGGWWRVDLPDAPPEVDYSYLLDHDRTPLPDPRSRWQPGGVHAPSRRWDPESYEWGDQGWTGRQLAGSLVYELHIGTFTPAGTFDSATERLDHLFALGVDLIEVMPVNAVDGPRNWGYDGVLWYAVQQEYGGPAGLCRFVDACHQRGLGVILDVVHNHLGPSGAYLDRFGPYFGGSNLWGPSLNLDGANSDEVRRYVLDNVRMWFTEHHVDGLRLDAVHALGDTRAVHLLEEMAVETETASAHLRRPLTLIAESDLNDPRLVTAREAGGYGLTAQWDDDIHHSLHAALTGERQGYYKDFGSLGTVAAVLQHPYVHAAGWSTFRRRSHGRPVDTNRMPAHRFVAFLQDHDQVGNRAAGDRLSATLPVSLLACGAALLLTSPYTPMLFMGEEWGARTPFQFFSYFPDPVLREAVRDGRFAEFAEHGWSDSDEVPDPTDPATFERSRLDWSEPATEPHAGLLAMYRELIALRRARAELTDPWLDEIDVQLDEDERWIVVHRGALRVCVNLSGEARELPLDAAGGTVLLASVDDLSTDDSPTVVLPGESFAIVEVDGEL